jgi:hypothetical protein
MLGLSTPPRFLRGAYITLLKGQTFWTKRVDGLPTLGPGLLAVSGYSHVLDDLSHPEQRGRLRSLLKVRVPIAFCHTGIKKGNDHTI